MKKLIIFLTLLFIPFLSFAQVPEIITLTPVGITEKGAFLRAQFDLKIPPQEIALFWFRYGIDKNNLTQATQKIKRTTTEYILSQNIQDLSSGQLYYFQPFMYVDGVTTSGEKKSFQTKKINQEPVDQFALAEKNAFKFPKSNTSKTQNSSYLGEGLKPISSTHTFSWRDFFGFGKKEDQTEKDSHLVNDPSVLQKKQEQKEQKVQNINIKTSQQENSSDFRNPKSAAYDDELGEVIKFNYDTGYKNQYKNNYTNSKTTKNIGLNYPMLFLITLLLIVVIVLIYITLAKRKKVIHQKYQAQGMENSKPRYYIPRKRDVHDPRQNPNKAFFRNPPRK